ncbi:hypothetical protein HDV05_004051 [Chytridiales sp. JEL 0842]|nr:hypothetical protein HDV05_004051 [Chytridiales sp. JEL 0842]
MVRTRNQRNSNSAVPTSPVRATSPEKSNKKAAKEETISPSSSPKKKLKVDADADATLTQKTVEEEQPKKLIAPDAEPTESAVVNVTDEKAQPSVVETSKDKVNQEKAKPVAEPTEDEVAAEQPKGVAKQKDDDDGDDDDDASDAGSGTGRHELKSNNRNAMQEDEPLKTFDQSKRFERKPKTTVDREKQCPFLIRAFVKQGMHHTPSEFARRLPESAEVQIHTWKDATLREVAILISQSNPALSDPTARISFRSIFPDRTLPNSFQGKDLGAVSNVRRFKEEDMTLEDLRFVAGDYLDVCVMLSGERTPPNGNGNDDRAERFAGAGGGGPERRNIGGGRFNPYGRSSGRGSFASGLSIRGRARGGAGGARDGDLYR